MLYFVTSNFKKCYLSYSSFYNKCNVMLNKVSNKNDMESQKTKIREKLTLSSSSTHELQHIASEASCIVQKKRKKIN